jgi:GNAT superfamily N-acetyltransferase
MADRASQPPSPAVVRDWVAGWSRSRDLPVAVESGGLLRTVVGLSGRDVEHVVLDADEHPRRIDQAARSSLDDPDPWIYVPTADPGRVSDRLAEHGLATATSPEWLMTSVPASGRAALPPGFVVAAQPSPHRVEVRVAAPDGTTAASGQMGLAGPVAVPDRVVTLPRHRRQGLGRAVMTLLAAQAVEHGATRAVLVASDQGRGLYLSLGWQVLGAVVVARRR